MKIILGSKSPRRKELLKQMGFAFETYLQDVDEDIVDFSDPQDYVKKTALKKGKAISEVFPNDLVICADTIVVHDNRIREKPKTKAEAYQMIEELQDDFHYVHTAVYLGLNDKIELFIETTKVTIDKMSNKEITEYINTDEPYDKAGGYAIQGLFSRYVKQIDGDYYNVMGLPVNKLYREIKKLGF
ncbi:MAG TPA: Maf family protein [Bacilli bacterium]|nr:Maf family protein [Bacilli bacterium]